jgi:hypothetical protein
MMNHEKLRQLQEIDNELEWFRRDRANERDYADLSYGERYLRGMRRKLLGLPILPAFALEGVDAKETEAKRTHPGTLPIATSIDRSSNRGREKGEGNTSTKKQNFGLMIYICDDPFSEK